MKRLLLSFGLLLFSCTTSEPKVENITTPSVDSVLLQSQKGIDSATTVNKKSDAATKKDIIKFIYKIKYLNTEVEKFKTERIQLMSLQNVNTEKIIYKIDTVYIETKRNFWGKEKTNIKVVSDSTIKESIDSISKQKVDSL